MDVHIDNYYGYTHTCTHIMHTPYAPMIKDTHVYTSTHTLMDMKRYINYYSHDVYPKKCTHAMILVMNGYLTYRVSCNNTHMHHVEVSSVILF